MNHLSVTIAASFLLAMIAFPLEAAKPPGAAGALTRAEETTVFAFQTKSGKTAALCRGPKGAYLVYRFGTAAKVELQYPAKLDASSWKKFMYWSYQRGSPYLGIAELRFENQGVEYTLSDQTSVLYNKQKKEEGYPRTATITVTMKGKEVTIVGNSDTVVGELEAVSRNNKVKLDEDMMVAPSY